MKAGFANVSLLAAFAAIIGADIAMFSRGDHTPAKTIAIAPATNAPVAAAQQPAAPRPMPSEIKVFPTNIVLSTARDRQAIVVQAIYPDTVTRDATKFATFAFGRDGLVRRDGNVFYPGRNGETVMRVSFLGCSANVPVRVTGATNDLAISFKRDVMPVIMRGGCNTGACHGSARGQDGFRLSLFGFDPDGDYHRITREQNARRIDLANPTNSLLLQKAIGAVPHTGGKLFTADSEYYATLLRWLDAGAPQDPETIRKAVALEVGPDRIVLEGEGTTQQLTARVRYSDGTYRDVTPTAVFIGNNDNSAKVGKDGRITASKRGEAFVMARYDVFNVGVPVIVVPAGQKFTFPNVPEFNYVDKFVHAKLRKLRIAPSDVCTDPEFLRRASLDVVGLLPTREEYDAFMADKDPKKREKLVDRLLARKEFVEMWVMKWAELLEIKSKNDFSYKSALSYYNWLDAKISGNVPINEIAREILSANGGSFKNPPANYYLVEKEPLKVAENVAQAFMGIRLQCSQCHNHPFDRWTLNDYYSYAAFFAQIGRKQGDDPRETIVFNSGSGRSEHPVTKKDMQPKFLGGDLCTATNRDRRAVFAEWLTSPDNPYFARNISNIIWAHFLGRGIVEPVDDVRVSNPAVNSDLIEALASHLVEYKFDFRKLVRDICLSRTYQLSSQTNPSNEDDLANFSHAAVRRVRAEVLLDCITQVTETKNKFQGLPLGARAVQIADGNATTYFLTTFGRASRETVCSCEVQMQPNLSQALHLLNGDSTQKKIIEGGVVKKMLDQKKDPAAIIDDFYVRCVTRPPTEKEKSELLAEVAKDKDKQPVLEDVFWALLNSKEFVFNH